MAPGRHVAPATTAATAGKSTTTARRHIASRASGWDRRAGDIGARRASRSLSWSVELGMLWGRRCEVASGSWTSRRCSQSSGPLRRRSRRVGCGFLCWLLRRLTVLTRFGGFTELTRLERRVGFSVGRASIGRFAWGLGCRSMCGTSCTCCRRSSSWCMWARTRTEASARVRAR